MKKLSICIPTYNRLDKLKRQVSFLINETEKYKDEIEIIISDNASSDGTEKYLDEIKNDFSHIIINRNTDNYGLIENFRISASLSSGDYIWMLSDDDYLQEGIIDSVMDVLSKYDVAHIFINYTVIKKGQISSQKAYCGKGGLFDEGFEMFKTISAASTLGALMFISANIYKKQYVSEATQILKIRGEDNNLALPLGWAVYSSSGKGYVIDEQLIYDDCDNISWSNSRLKVFARDTIAVCDVIAKEMNIENKFDKILLTDIQTNFPEIRFLLFNRNSDIDNYAMKWYWRRHKLRLICDFIIFPFYILTRIFEKCIKKLKGDNGSA